MRIPALSNALFCLGAIGCLFFLPSLARGQATCVGDECPGGAGPYFTITSVNTSGPIVGGNTGLEPLAKVKAVTVTVLPNNPIYNNGAAGAGATLIATSSAALVIDGYAVVFGDRLLIANQALAYQNGVYVVTATGSISAPYQLSRATDADTSDKLYHGVSTRAVNGTVNGGVGFVLTTNGTISPGNTAQLWKDFSGPSSGAVVGPGSAVTAGDLACWNNTSGTALKDCGGGISTKTSDYTVAQSDRFATLKLGGNTVLTVTLPSSGITAPFGVDFVNADSSFATWHAKTLSIQGGASCTLYPGQSAQAIYDGAWTIPGCPAVWQVPGSTANFYVSNASGNDANDGLSVATAWKTVQYSHRFIATGISASSGTGLNPTLNFVCPDTWTENDILAGPYHGFDAYAWAANASTPSTCLITAAINSQPTVLCTDYCTIISTGVGLAGGFPNLLTNQHSTFDLNGGAFGSCGLAGGAQAQAGAFGKINGTGGGSNPMFLYGATNCSYAFLAASAGAISMQGQSYNIPNSITYATALFAGNELGLMQTGQQTFGGAGAVSGIAPFTCEAVLNGVVDIRPTTPGGTLGTSVCTPALGGQYIHG